MRLATHRWVLTPQPGPPKRTPHAPENRDRTPGDSGRRPDEHEPDEDEDAVREWTYTPVRTPPPTRRSQQRRLTGRSWASPHAF